MKTINQPRRKRSGYCRVPDVQLNAASGGELNPKGSKRKPHEQHHSKLSAQLTIPSPSFEQIQERAFEIYQACGCVSGRELDDWLIAEMELNAEMELQFRVERELKSDIEE